MAGIIKPEYVWVTTATASWTNKSGAEALAKRRAGISEFICLPVFRVENQPFELVDKAMFRSKLKKSPYAHMYGKVIHGTPEGATQADISTLVQDGWGGINFSINTGDKSVVPYSKREVMGDFEFQTNKQANEPTVRCTSAAPASDGNHTCLVVVAMIVGEES
jgi:hypothetical protein